MISVCCWLVLLNCPLLGTGIISAIFHALGKAAILNELFTSLEITGAMLSQLSFRTQAELDRKPCKNIETSPPQGTTSLKTILLFCVDLNLNMNYVS